MIQSLRLKIYDLFIIFSNNKIEQYAQPMIPVTTFEFTIQLLLSYGKIY